MWIKDQNGDLRSTNGINYIGKNHFSVLDVILYADQDDESDHEVITIYKANDVHDVQNLVDSIFCAIDNGDPTFSVPDWIEAGK